MFSATHEWSSYQVTLLQAQSYQQQLPINFYDNDDEVYIQEEEEYSEDNKDNN